MVKEMGHGAPVTIAKSAGVEGRTDVLSSGSRTERRCGCPAFAGTENSERSVPTGEAGSAHSWGCPPAPRPDPDLDRLLPVCAGSWGGVRSRVKPEATRASADREAGAGGRKPRKPARRVHGGIPPASRLAKPVWVLEVWERSDAVEGPGLDVASSCVWSCFIVICISSTVL